MMLIRRLGRPTPRAEGEAEGLDRPGRPLEAADQCSRRAMTLLTDLEQFASDHRAHGALTNARAHRERAVRARTPSSTYSARRR